MAHVYWTRLGLRSVSNQTNTYSWFISAGNYFVSASICMPCALNDILLTGHSLLTLTVSALERMDVVLLTLKSFVMSLHYQ